MQIAICYYSGAGNTRFIADKFVHYLENRAHQVVRKRIVQEGLDRLVDDSFDLLGIGFPVYFRDTPELVYDFLETLDGKNRPIFFFLTKGLYSGNALKNLSDFAEKRNFQTVGAIEFFMPGTDGLVFFARKGSLTENILKRIHSREIDPKIDHFVTTVLKGEPSKKLRPKWYTVFDEQIVKRLELHYNDRHRGYIRHFFADTQTCIACMQCVMECPRGNISFESQIQFGAHCDVCLNCIHHCPTEAIQIGNMTRGNVRYNQVEIL